MPSSRPILVTLTLALFCTPLGCHDNSWQLWHSFSTHFIDSATGRVFDPNGDQHTTSEGQAYALFFALAANDRVTFNRVLAWTQSNLAAGDLSMHLPASGWGKSADGSSKILDPNSASDADTWLAYTLLEAGTLWNLPAHYNLGRSMLALIAKNEVANLSGFGPMLLPGPAGFQHGAATILNPSDLPLFLFQYFAVIDPSGPWYAIVSGIPRMLEQSVRHGFAMDWIEYDPGDGFHPVADPAAAGSGASSMPAPVGSYDAIRVYLWAGLINPEVAARVSILDSLAGMGSYLATHDTPPEKISDQGIPSGESGPIGFSAALIPYLRALPDAQKSASMQAIRLGSHRNPATGFYGNNADYYGQCLALFSTGFSTGKFSFGQAGELIVNLN